ncbi:MAG: HTH domain-containing protein [bacterium]
MSSLFLCVSAVNYYLNGYITFYRHITKDVHKMSVKSVGKVSVKNVGKVFLKDATKKERKEYIYNKIKSKELFTFVTLAKELAVSNKTIERDIEELKKEGKIKFVGSKRSGYYEIIL